MIIKYDNYGSDGDEIILKKSNKNKISGKCNIYFSDGHSEIIYVER